MKKYHKWTIKDITYLKQHRKEKTIAEWANYFGISIIAIENLLRRYKIRGDHWEQEDDIYLRENRPLKSLAELAEYFGVTKMAIQKRCEKIGATVGHRKNAGRKKDLNKIKTVKVAPVGNSNIEKMWQQQKKKNASKIKKFNSVQRDLSSYKSVKLSDRTTLLIKPGTDIGRVMELYKSKKIV